MNNDLISREALKQELVVNMVNCIRTNEDNKATMAEQVLNKIDEAPTVDAVEVVRCGECEFIDDKCAHGIVCICDHGGMCGTFVADTDFCSCGKRRMDGE